MDKYISIFLYYFVYFIAFCFFLKADKTNDYKRSRIYILCGIIVLSAFACFRGRDVGWDTGDTVNSRFERVKSFGSFRSLLSWREHTKEPIYWMLSYIIQKATNSSCVFLFVIQFLTVGPIGLLAYKKRKDFSVTFMMTVYMMLFYQLSFNIIRQSVSAAFCLLAYINLEKKSYVKAAIIAILCCLFHNGGFIGVALILLLYILTEFQSTSSRSVLIIVFILLGVCLLFTWETIVRWLLKEGFLGDNYQLYVDAFSGEIESKYTTFRYRNIVIEVLRIIGTIIVLFGLNGIHTGTEKEIRMLKYSSILSLVIYSVFVFVFNSTLGHRGTLYLDYLQIVLFARYYPKQLINNGRLIRGQIIIPKNGIQNCLIYCFMFNFIVYMLLNFGHTLPYQIS